MDTVCGKIPIGAFKRVRMIRSRFSPFINTKQYIIIYKVLLSKGFCPNLYNFAEYTTPAYEQILQRMAVFP
jgi:hypothetical protein